MTFLGVIKMTEAEYCPKQACGFWGIPVEKLGSLKDLSDDMYECCLWHESKQKCSRNPRFVGDPRAKDYFDPAHDEELQKEMSHAKSHISEAGQPVTRHGSRSRIKIEDLSIEELCRQVNIQSNLFDLQTKDKGKVKSALNTLCTITKHTDRKDALYVLVGYYKTEVRTIDEIIDFFYSTEMAFSVDLSMMVLSDLVKFKDLGSRRIFVHDLLSHLSLFRRHINDERKNEIRTLIQNSAWGDKTKRKFLDSLFYREFERRNACRILPSDDQC